MLNITVSAFNLGRSFGKFKSRKSPKRVWKWSWKSLEMRIQNCVGTLRLCCITQNFEGSLEFRAHSSTFGSYKADGWISWTFNWPYDPGRGQEAPTVRLLRSSTLLGRPSRPRALARSHADASREWRSRWRHKRCGGAAATSSGTCGKADVTRGVVINKWNNRKTKRRHKHMSHKGIAAVERAYLRSFKLKGVFQVTR